MTREKLEEQRAQVLDEAHHAFDAELARIREQANADEAKARQALNVARADAEAAFQRAVAEAEL